MAGNFRMDDYVDVAQRIHEFYEKYPDGRLCAGSPPSVVEIGGRPFVWYHARAYRTPDDPVPGDGWAAEPVPGPTQFTKDSELMNAETAAWGRAIVALGFATKKIASAQEVRNRSGETAAQNPASEKTEGFQNPAGERRSDAQANKLRAQLRTLVAAKAITEPQFLSAAHALDVSAATQAECLDRLTKSQASNLIDRLEKLEANLKAQAAA